MENGVLTNLEPLILFSALLSTGEYYHVVDAVGSLKDWSEFTAISL